MGILLLFFAVVISYATFIENDFDAATARMFIYNAKWFEVLLIVMVINFAGMIFTKRLYHKSKLNILIIHIALIIIIIGAAVTRYIGYEGTMHIRNGETSNQFVSLDTYFSMGFGTNDDVKTYKKKVLISPYAKNFLNETVEASGNSFNVALQRYHLNAIQTIAEDQSGSPYISIIAGDRDGRHDLFLKEGESRDIHGIGFSFGDTTNQKNIQIVRKDTSLYIKTPLAWSDYLHHGRVPAELSAFKPIQLMEIQRFGTIQFLINDYKEKGSLTYEITPGVKSHTTSVLELKINDERYFLEPQKSKTITVDGVDVDLYVGPQVLTLPFSLKLNKFELERYPGSNSPSSYASDIVLIDERTGLETPYRIFMNNILEYEGYRFYQSSYDRDELGTILSVNHDYWGTMITYAGYFLLFGSLLLSFFTRKTRFRRTLDFIKETHEKRKNLSVSVILLLIALFSFNEANSQEKNNNVISKEHARKFGSILVQGQDGRMMPVNTLANQIMIKVHKQGSYEGLTAEQVLLGSMNEPIQWRAKPFVKVNHPEVQTLLEINGSLARYTDFFNQQGQYKLNNAVSEAHNKKPALRNKYDKELIKVNERINIFHNLLHGTMLKVLPVPDDPGNKWTTPAAFITASRKSGVDSLLFENYLNELKSAQSTGDYANANEKLELISAYQRDKGRDIVPDESKIKFEIFYNRANIFKNLFPVYFTIGVFLVFIFFVQILKPSYQFKKVTKTFLVILLLAFVLQTLGLILRWHVSGHAPWSNGYESMIYISWATMLAGFIFMRTSPVTLALTSMLAGITLLTAHMSWMDPEITNLVPVLKSYWLTIHVATITASYGFLALGSLLGFFNLLLMSFRKEGNVERLNLMLKELTLVIELALMCGIVLLIIGNFLGAIWANESWGRYWGWDPKETWTLVTIIFYSFILHLRLIPGLRNLVFINFLSLIGFGTVLMTYFGVNYYLSGLHSYAAGDPVPIPTFVYYTIFVIVIVSVLAAYNEFALRDKSEKEAGLIPE